MLLFLLLLSFVEASKEEIARLLAKAAPKPSGSDPMPTWLLKECTDECTPLLTPIVNSSLTNALVPRGLKTALVQPRVKKENGSPDDLSNYRPISNLSVLSKLLERFVVSQLDEHIKNNNLMDNIQSAYRR